MKKLFSFLLLSLFIFWWLTFAHPWNTAADGCHYCRTNCDYRWVAWNQRHCHWWSTYVTPTYTSPTYTTPTYTQTCWVNSYSSNWSCVCYAWYTWKYPTISSNYDCVLKKTPTEQCQEQYWYNATAWTISDTCMCKVGYEWSSDRTYCKLKTVNTCWLNSYLSNGKCSCNVWYTWEDPDDEDNLDCVLKKTATEICQNTYWTKSISVWSDMCWCIDWYIINSSFKNLWCISATYSCQIDFWSHMYATWKADSNWTYKCVCEKWYVFSKENQACEIATTENSCLDTINGYLATDWKCYCNDNYVRDNAKNMCIIQEATDIEWPENELQEAISWMYNGWLTSYNTIDKFLPNDYLTREQASKIFVRFANTLWKYDDVHKNHTFTDVKNADPTLVTYIWNAYSMWMIKWSNNRFMPFNKLTQAQALAIIIRAIDGVQNETNWVWYGEYYNLANKYSILNGLWFNFNQLDSTYVTRGEVALLLFRTKSKE